MSERILALKWGVGYYLINPPYTEKDITFIRKNIPTNIDIIQIGLHYKQLSGVKLVKRIGIMQLIIDNETVTIHTLKAGSCKRIESKKYAKLQARMMRLSVKQGTYKPDIKIPKSSIPVKLVPSFHIPIAELSVSDILHYGQECINIDELKMNIAILYRLVEYVSELTNIPEIAIWNKLYSYSKTTNETNKAKLLVIAHYSNDSNRCIRCNETDIRVLSIDHIDGNGADHKRQLKQTGISLYKWLIDNNYPDGFQVLCMNCQWRKRSENNEFYKQAKFNITSK